MTSEIRTNIIKSRAGLSTVSYADTGIIVSGIVTATSFSGSGANLTSLPAQATIANNADNRVITGGSGVNLNGEANLKFDGGGTLTIVDTELTESTDNFSINIQSGNNDFYVKSGGTIFTAFKGSSKDLQLTSGNLVIGTSGKGIDFSANAGSSATGSTTSSQLLDDYEEGTWTPSTSEGPAHTIFGTPFYTKIGRQVTVNCYMNITSSTSSNAIRIDGLPYTALSNNHYSIGACYTQFTGTNHVFFQVQNNAAFGYIYTDLGNGVPYNTANASGGYFLVTVTYFAA